MDKILELIADKQSEIAKVQQKIDELARQHERLTYQLEGLKEAASVIHAPAPQKAGAVERPSRPSGRQRGAISQPWRNILKDAWELDAPLNYGDFHSLAASNDVHTKIANVRERVRSMTENGLLEGDAETGYTVTEHAARKFGFPEKNETPAAGAEGASRVTGEVAASPHIGSGND